MGITAQAQTFDSPTDIKRTKEFVDMEWATKDGGETKFIHGETVEIREYLKEMLSQLNADITEPHIYDEKNEAYVWNIVVIGADNIDLRITYMNDTIVVVEMELESNPMVGYEDVK